jgi:hypothetical protein
MHQQHALNVSRLLRSNGIISICSLSIGHEPKTVNITARCTTLTECAPASHEPWVELESEDLVLSNDAERCTLECGVMTRCVFSGIDGGNNWNLAQDAPYGKYSRSFIEAISTTHNFCALGVERSDALHYARPGPTEEVKLGVPPVPRSHTVPE